VQAPSRDEPVGAGHARDKLFETALHVPIEGYPEIMKRIIFFATSRLRENFSKQYLTSILGHPGIMKSSSYGLGNPGRRSHRQLFEAVIHVPPGTPGNYEKAYFLRGFASSRENFS
jgi:hypothetical protein